MTDPMKIVNAKPTKDFFINKLIRDIELLPAIADLVDNSVDGALRMRKGRRYTGLWIRLAASGTKFVIEDNCGGIEVKTARDYAFRFGRPEEEGFEKHSIGQFGVGMKRALFKLGKKVKVTSVSKRSSFTLAIDVEKWRAAKDDWNFIFDEVNELKQKDPDSPSDEWGTKIEITDLRQGVSEDLANASRISTLKEDIQDRHQISIDKGLAVILNKVELSAKQVDIKVGASIKPAYKVLTPEKGVKVRLYCGLSDSNPDEAGWWVFCNDRLVLRADQKDATGWGWRGGPQTIPKFHNQYAPFRGYAFFDSDDPSLLPWNTTKTDIDADSPIFRQVKRELVFLAYPVITFLNQLDTEKTATKDTGEQGPLEKAFDGSSTKRLESIRLASQFRAPRGTIVKPKPQETTITYQRPVSIVKTVKGVLEVRGNREVGEKTFDYFYEKVIDDNDNDE